VIALVAFDLQMSSVVQKTFDLANLAQEQQRLASNLGETLLDLVEDVLGRTFRMNKGECELCPAVQSLVRTGTVCRRIEHALDPEMKIARMYLRCCRVEEDRLESHAELADGLVVLALLG